MFNINVLLDLREGIGLCQRRDAYFSEIYRFLYGSRLFFVFSLVDHSV